MNNLKNLIRPEIRSLVPYSSARSECTAASNIRLDANENPWPPYGSRVNYNRYPEPQPVKLRQTLAALYQVNNNELLLTRGLDEAIDLLIRLFCIPKKDTISIIPPTFGYYKTSALINGIKVIETTVNGFIPGKISFLCSPNNPTGESISLLTIAKLSQKCKGVLVVDEAYIEFSQKPTAINILKNNPNLIVLRTLSKAYALAGERIGIVIANPIVINLLKKIIPPYPIAESCINIALQALSPIGLYYTRNKIKQLNKQKQFLHQELCKCPFVQRVYPSDANFLLVVFEDVDAVDEKLKRAGIIVRNRSQEIPGALRITVGTREENELVLAALGRINTVQKPPRKAVLFRKTTETEVFCELLLNNLGEAKISTSVRFLDHLFEQLAKHSGISIDLKATGDIDVDTHHTIEDTAIVLGETLKKALGDKCGIRRFGFVLPMDEAQAQVSIDLSGRAYCQFEGIFQSPFIGDVPTEMIEHFFQSLSLSLGAAIHIIVSGSNTHHMIEACFKSFAHALKQAISNSSNTIPSTKGVL